MMKKNKVKCEICETENLHCLSEITLSGAYGTFHNDKLTLAICPKCYRSILSFILSRTRAKNNNEDEENTID